MIPTALEVVGTLPSPTGAKAVVEAVAQLVERASQSREIEAIGVVVPGLVDDESGIGLLSTNLAWRDAPIAEMLQQRLGRPVAFGHDVRAATAVEYRALGPHVRGPVLFVPIGTGIAAGVVVDGQVIRAEGRAGELGHAPSGHHRLCGCGLIGCLEAAASARAIAEKFQELSGKEAQSAAEVIGMVPENPVAQQVWSEAVDALAHALVWTASLLAPEVVVIGGGVGQAGPQLFDPLEEALSQRLSIHRRPRLVPAHYGDRSALWGAAHLGADRASARIV